jgi:drug/metabolite transporter (DMT)-like permease
VLAVLLSLASALGYGGSDYAAGLAGRAASVIQVTILAEAVSLAVTLLFVPWVSPQAPGLATVAWSAVGGVGGVAGAMALYLGFRQAAFSVAAPLSAVASAGFSVLAGLLFGEQPGSLALTGIVLTLPAIVAVSVSPRESPAPDLATESPNADPVTADPATESPNADPVTAEPVTAEPGTLEPGTADPGTLEPGIARPSTGRPAHPSIAQPGQPAGARSAAGPPATPPGGRRRAVSRRSAVGMLEGSGVVWGLIAGTGFGILFIGLNRAGSSHDLWPLAISQAASLVAVLPLGVARGQLRLPSRRIITLAVITGVAGSAGGLCYFLATHAGLLAVTAVITALYPASTILLARLLIGERLTAVRIAGLCLAAVSVGLIAASGSG